MLTLSGLVWLAQSRPGSRSNPCGTAWPGRIPVIGPFVHLVWTGVRNFPAQTTSVHRGEKTSTPPVEPIPTASACDGERGGDSDYTGGLLLPGEPHFSSSSSLPPVVSPTGVYLLEDVAITGVLALDVASSNTRQIASPPRPSDHDVIWQLGVAAGHLCASICGLDSVELYRLVADDEWKLLDAIYGRPPGKDTRPRLLRFESDHLEVLLRIGGRIMALEIVHGTDQEVRLEGTILPERDEAIVGRKDYIIYLMSDSYLGCDQEYEFTVDVKDAGED